MGDRVIGDEYDKAYSLFVRSVCASVCAPFLLMFPRLLDLSTFII